MVVGLQKLKNTTHGQPQFHLDDSWLVAIDVPPVFVGLPWWAISEIRISANDYFAGAFSARTHIAVPIAAPTCQPTRTTQRATQPRSQP